MKKQLPFDVLALPDAAHLLGCTEDQLLIAEAFGQLETVSVEVGDRAVRAVTLAEVERLRNATVRQPERMMPQERKSLLYLLGTFARIWMIGEPAEAQRQHYKVRAILAEDAARRLHLGMLRSEETDALLIREGLDLVESLGIRDTPALVENKHEERALKGVEMPPVRVASA